MSKVTIEEDEKTVYRYDASARTFKKAAILLLFLAGGMMIFAVVWFSYY